MTLMVATFIERRDRSVRPPTYGRVAGVGSIDGAMLPSRVRDGSR